MNNRYSLYLDELADENNANLPNMLSPGEKNLPELQYNQSGFLDCFDVIGGFCNYLVERSKTSQTIKQVNYAKKALDTWNKETEKQSAIALKNHAAKLQIYVQNQKAMMRVNSEKAILYCREVAETQGMAIDKQRRNKELARKELETEIYVLNEINRQIKELEPLLVNKVDNAKYQQYQDYYAAALKGVTESLKKVE